MTTAEENEMSTTTTITMSYEAAVAATVALGYERRDAIDRQASRMGPDQFDIGRDAWVGRGEGWRLDESYLARLDEALAALDDARAHRYEAPIALAG